MKRSIGFFLVSKDVSFLELVRNDTLVLVQTTFSKLFLIAIACSTFSKSMKLIEGGGSSLVNQYRNPAAQEFTENNFCTTRKSSALLTTRFLN